MPATEKDLRDAGFDGAVGYRDEAALRLLCAFNGVDWKKAPPGWWVHPNESTKAAWQRVADEARLIYGPPMRKIIQIAFDSHPHASYSLHAICDDGSIWAMHPSPTEHPTEQGPPRWERVPPIPQDDDVGGGRGGI